MKVFWPHLVVLRENNRKDFASKSSFFFSSCGYLWLFKEHNCFPHTSAALQSDLSTSQQCRLCCCFVAKVSCAASSTGFWFSSLHHLSPTAHIKYFCCTQSVYHCRNDTTLIDKLNPNVLSGSWRPWALFLSSKNILHIGLSPWY